ncbi:PrsW family glutamic-type intramembrane protease [Umezakia ovalisporum]|uniref:PrsW family glutamic-type intramembrane protease n=2 Tax=Umezakia ovalisporum TaxID=75695 RepID=A0AA43GWE9_9CYAN|nr:PrsW family glutamic-type intramembrane protease [Umezakia ovalisporum]MBI1242075.1 PrsW family intramembrane metalloprotease [Nostoc sp. RI_552]MDH6056685.1 PrsW family glutamic-type intramembrane protease [Umezakia ovalisporum FSS-43]MDH6062992.1 PrsW family glutamic-type intramembrane protease [Umezakia ovalisporum FSS-62]MDH6068641.1 PrsW family glutamic-type intramembrane protease [Umezakia ovalisporum APH033B]MDH6070133.1 PrsW family glutamic-type intramembrane protease [Umezakia oval
MTGKNTRHNAFLRLVSGNAASFGSESRYSLLTSKEVVIGRDPTCQVVLDAMKYRMVSRRHAVVRPLSSSKDGQFTWIVCDLNSANGTFLNGKCLTECQELHAGDRISMGSDGPQFIFEYDLISQPTVATKQIKPLPSASKNNGHTHLKQPDSVSFTQLFPIISTGKDLTRKAYLIPGILTVIFVVLMFATVGHPQANQVIVATYIASAAYYFVYQLCGKEKPWWVLVGTALSTTLILLSPLLNFLIFLFRVILPGNLPAPNEPTTFTELLVRMFFGAGLMEELLKALPLIGAYFIGRSLTSPWRERIGIWEPLDGILLGTASAIGFTLLETLGQYVPQITQQVGIGAAGQLAGFQLLIPRILGSVAGHMAYSGYLGYFIGLAVLKPRMSWQILSIGYLSASALHALWNAIGSINALLLVVVGVVSYAFLMAAILKARVLSPTRSQNFATRFIAPK